MTTYIPQRWARAFDALRLATTYPLARPIIGKTAGADFGRLFLGDGVTLGGRGVAFIGEVSAEPCVRLSLTSGVPITEADVAAATSVYAMPFRGNRIPLQTAAGSWSYYEFAQLSLALNSNAAHAGYHQSSKVFDLWATLNGSTLVLGTGPAWLNLTDPGTGGTTTEREIFGGLAVNKNAITVRIGTASGDTIAVAARRATLLGSVLMTADGQTEDSVLKRYLSNVHNAVPRSMRASEPAANWTQDTASGVRQANANLANQLDYLHATSGRLVRADVSATVTSAAQTFPVVAVGLDSVLLGASMNIGQTVIINSNSLYGNPFSRYIGYPGMGRHKLVWLEKSGAQSVTWSGPGTPHGGSGITGETDN